MISLAAREPHFVDFLIFLILFEGGQIRLSSVFYFSFVVFRDFIVLHHDWYNIQYFVIVIGRSYKLFSK